MRTGRYAAQLCSLPFQIAAGVCVQLDPTERRRRVQWFRAINTVSRPARCWNPANSWWRRRRPSSAGTASDDVGVGRRVATRRLDHRAGQRPDPAGSRSPGSMILVPPTVACSCSPAARWRNRPDRLSATCRWRRSGTSKGSSSRLRRHRRFELVFISADGTASPFDVPAGFVSDGKEFVRRLQVRLGG